MLSTNSMQELVVKKVKNPLLHPMTKVNQAHNNQKMKVKKMNLLKNFNKKTLIMS